jgi:histidine phosphotransferase ChpT
VTLRPDLSALVGSRICHDLISPLGAIGNGIELLEMAGMPQTPELALISDSVGNANARIKFFRIAFGPAAVGQTIARAEVVSSLAAAAARLRYDWRVGGELLRSEVRIAFLILQCVETAMPWGGDVIIERDDAGWNLVARAERLRVEPELWKGLTDPEVRPGVSAAQVQFALLPEALSAEGRSLSVQITPDSIVMRY